MPTIPELTDYKVEFYLAKVHEALRQLYDAGKTHIITDFGEWHEGRTCHPADLSHELSEAKLEIARHHRDFTLIRGLLDDREHMTIDGIELAKLIRNVVG